MKKHLIMKKWGSIFFLTLIHMELISLNIVAFGREKIVQSESDFVFWLTVFAYYGAILLVPAVILFAIYSAVDIFRNSQISLGSKIFWIGSFWLCFVPLYVYFFRYSYSANSGEPHEH